MAVGQQVNLDWPARGKWHVCGEVFAGQHDAFAGLLELERASKEVGAKLFDRGQDLGGARSHVWVGIDLAVRVVQGHADLLPAVFKRKHLAHATKFEQRLGAVGPRINHGANARDWLASHRALVLWAEDHDLAATDRVAGRTKLEVGDHRVVHVVYLELYRTKRWALVFEHRDIETVGYFALKIIRGWAQRAEVCGRQKRPRLAVGGNRDPLAGERVEAHLGRGGAGVELSRVGLALGGQSRGCIVKVDDVSAIG